MALEIVADICEFVFVYFIINCFREIKNGDHVRTVEYVFVLVCSTLILFYCYWHPNKLLALVFESLSGIVCFGWGMTISYMYSSLNL